MKRETLKIKDEVLGIFIYEGFGKSPKVIDGKNGKYQRHIVLSEKFGVVHVITNAMSSVIPRDSKVKIIEPLFYPDRSVNGPNVAPCMNILAKKLEVVKG